MAKQAFDIDVVKLEGRKGFLERRKKLLTSDQVRTGGFVFLRCTQAVINSFSSTASSGNRNYTITTSHPPMFSGFYTLSRSKDCREIVILYKILPSKDTDGFENLASTAGSGCRGERVVEVNGQPISSLWDLVKAFKDNHKKPSLVKFANGQLLVVQPETSLARQNLTKKYAISLFSSPSVTPIDHKLPFVDELESLQTKEAQNGEIHNIALSSMIGK